MLVIVLEGQLLWIKIHSHTLDTRTHTNPVLFDKYKTGAARIGPLISFAVAGRFVQFVLAF